MTDNQIMLQNMDLPIAETVAWLVIAGLAYVAIKGLYQAIREYNEIRKVH